MLEGGAKRNKPLLNTTEVGGDPTDQDDKCLAKSSGAIEDDRRTLSANLLDE